MKNNLKIFFCIMVLHVLQSCLNSQVTPLERFQTAAKPVENLSGDVELIDGSKINLGAYSSKPLLLIFASETCEICRKETTALKARYSELQNIEILTVLVGSIREDAQFWSSGDNWEDSTSVPWSVGFEEIPDLYVTYCQSAGTPCSLIQLPGQGVVVQKIGELGVEQVLETLKLNTTGLK